MNKTSQNCKTFKFIGVSVPTEVRNHHGGQKKLPHEPHLAPEPRVSHICFRGSIVANIPELMVNHVAHGEWILFAQEAMNVLQDEI